MTNNLYKNIIINFENKFYSKNTQINSTKKKLNINLTQ